MNPVPQFSELAHAVQVSSDADVWVTLDAPVAPVSEIARLGDAQLVWVPPEGGEGGPDAYGAEHCVGFGVARRFSASGADRFERIETAVGECFSSLRSVPLCDGPTLPPRVFGGFAFRSGDCDSPPWRSFGDAQFVLPRMLYASARGRATLQVWVSKEHRQGLDEALGEALELRAKIAELSSNTFATAANSQAPYSEAPERRGRVQQVVTREQWTQLVQGALGEIRAGRAEKLVAARVAELRLGADISLADTLAALGARHPLATRWMFSSGGATFLGASPEQLVSKRGRNLRSEALAGTFPKQAHALLAELVEQHKSPKEHEEHQPVLEAIVRTLQPLCSTLDYPATPELRELRHLVHLRTPIAGLLAEPLHVLSLVRALHPTPAVGGVPQQAAIDWIARNEPVGRGWYAGPIGWFDVEGDGEFAVALRSGVVQGDTATLHAGAGIVRGSEPDLEFSETELKFQALLGALRVSAR